MPAVSEARSDSEDPSSHSLDVAGEMDRPEDLEGGKRKGFGVGVDVEHLIAEDEIVRLGVAEAPARRFAAAGVELPGSVGIDSGLGAEAPLERGDGEDLESDIEETWDLGGRRKSPIGLLALTGLVVLGVLGVAYWRIPRGDALITERASVVSEKLAAEQREQEEATRLMERIEAALRGYLAAETVEEKARFVRHPERVRPLMERYYAERKLVPQRFERLKSLYPVGVENYPFLVVRAGLESGVVLPLLLQQSEDDQILFDWESEVAYQPMSMAEFLERRPEDGVDFRVYVRYDQFYAFEFADSEKYLSLMLTERNSDAFLFGYVERGSAAHEEVARLLNETDAPQEAMLLKLRFLPGSLGTRSVLVEEVVAPRWAYIGELGG